MPVIADCQSAREYIRAHDKRVNALSRMSVATLTPIDRAALRSTGTERIYGKMSKDELISEILSIEFPGIQEARRIYYETS